MEPANTFKAMWKCTLCFESNKENLHKLGVQQSSGNLSSRLPSVGDIGKYSYITENF